MNSEEKILEPSSANDGRCPHAAAMAQCPSPKKSLAHAIVQCNIHLGRINDPRILPCGHSFCFRCLLVLNEERKQPTTTTPSSNNLVITCPLCRRANHLESIESLTINYAISDLLEIFDAEEKEDERIRRETMAEMEHTVGILKSLKTKCEQRSTMQNGDRFYIDCLQDSVIATEKRLSFLNNLAREIEEERDRQRRERYIKNLHYTCLAYQRLAEMLDGEMQVSNGSKTPRFEKAGHVLEMYKNSIVLEYRPTETMTERRSRVWFTIMFSILIEQCWLLLRQRRFGDAARQLSREFSNKFDDVEGVWIAVVGRRPLGCWIWKDEHDYACLDVGDYRLIIYRRNLNLDTFSKDDHKDNKDTLEQTNLDMILKDAVQLKEKDEWRELNVAKFLREHLQKDYEGYFWHTAAGYTDDFAVSASVNGKHVEIKTKISQAGNWKAVVWEG